MPPWLRSSGDEGYEEGKIQKGSAQWRRRPKCDYCNSRNVVVNLTVEDEIFRKTNIIHACNQNSCQFRAYKDHDVMKQEFEERKRRFEEKKKGKEEKAEG